MKHMISRQTFLKKKTSSFVLFKSLFFDICLKVLKDVIFLSTSFKTLFQRVGQRTVMQNLGALICGI